MRAHGINVSKADSQAEASEVKYGLTNFRFGGDAVMRVPLPESETGLHLRVEKQRSYQEAEERSGLFNTVELTCEGVFSGRLESVEALDQLMTDVCYVLSVARGTKIQWIYREHLDSDGQLLRTRHCPHVTKPYSPWGVLRPSYSAETLRFLEQAIPGYRRRMEEGYGLSLGPIDIFLDARLQTDYLEVRGVKAAVAAEVLRSAYVSATGRRTRVLPDDEFERVLPELSTSIRRVLQEHGVRSSERGRIAMRGKLKGLNRPTFEQDLRSLCKFVEFTVSEENLRLFVRCRDKLIHRGRFYCDLATEKERKELEPHPDNVREYRFLLRILDGLFLSLLAPGFQSPDRAPRSLGLL